MDILERLRNCKAEDYVTALRHEAADEIERLRGWLKDAEPYGLFWWEGGYHVDENGKLTKSSHAEPK